MLWIIPAVAFGLLLPILLVLKIAEKADARFHASGQTETTTTDTTDGPVYDGRVFDILKQVYRDLNRQHAGAVRPWVPSLLKHNCDDPGVALTAVQWTIRDLLDRPVGDGVEYVPGLPFRFDLTVLRDAEKELLKMKEGEGVCS